MEQASDESVDGNEGMAARYGGDDVDPWLSYVLSEEDVAALHAMLLRADQRAATSAQPELRVVG